MDPGEACDDGNIQDQDGCNATCKSNETCGNGIVDSLVGEICDASDGTCSADCLHILGCGNGVQESGEQCDDGNPLNDDSCVGCRFAFCRDGFQYDAGLPDGGHVELCDTGGESATCNSDCTPAMCGDSVQNAHNNEDCDTGGVNTLNCNANCKFALCGDGFWNPSANEACDDGGNSPTCDYDCTLVSCGDRLVNSAANEDCDDGTAGMTRCAYGTQSCQVCNANCQGSFTARGPYCGDGDAGVNGGVDSDAGEVCDDGNNMDETSCPYGTPRCTACNKTCDAGLSLTGPYCGDHAKDVAFGEACDDFSLDAGGICHYGETCPDMCIGCTQVISLVGPKCGDGVINNPDGGEACDDGNSFTCGSCNKSCSKVRIAVAKGFITVRDGNALKDGETFTLNNGAGVQHIFEFDSNGAAAVSGSVLIPFSRGPPPDGADSIADTLLNEVNSTGMGIDAGVVGSGFPCSTSACTVLLLNLQPGIDGNQKIVTSPTNNPAFTVSGMDGGAGRDCDVDVGCVSDQDCLSNLTCQYAGPKTCQ